MNPKRAPDEQGIVAELLRCSSETRVETIAKLFTNMLEPEACIPGYGCVGVLVIFGYGIVRLHGVVIVVN